MTAPRSQLKEPLPE